MTTVDTKGIPRPDLLAALYNRSKAQGMGLLHFDPTPMKPEEAARLIAENTREERDGTKSCYFDYLKGRVMKVDVLPDQIDAWGYDRDNGEGAFDDVVNCLVVLGMTDSSASRK